MDITYAIENDLGADEFVDVLKRSTLAERRPVDDARRIADMLAHGNLIITARDPDKGDVLIGVSRNLTDFAFCCYCSDLAVDQGYQGRGIGRGLIEESMRAAGENARFVLLSAPDALGYYPHIGMRKLENAFDFPTKERP